MTARRWAGAFWGGVLSVVASGCGGASPAAPVPAAPPPPQAQQPARPPRTGEVMLLTGENDFRAAAWLASGMLVASTERALWFLRTDKPDEATLVERQPGGPRYFGSIVTARDQDVFALYSEDGTLWLHRGTQPLGSIVVPSLAEVRLSHDGKLALASESVDGNADQTWLIDVDTQKAVTKLAGVDGRFSSDGKRVLTDAGVFDLTGKRLHTTTPAKRFVGPSTAWIGEHALVMGDRKVQIVDTASGTRRSLDMPCRKGISPVDWADEAGHRLVRTCGNRVYVLDVPSLTVTRVPLGEQARDGYSSRVLATSDGADLVVVTISEANGELRYLIEDQRVTVIDDADVFGMVRDAAGQTIELSRASCNFSVRGSQLDARTWCGGALRKDSAFAASTVQGSLLVADRRAGGGVSVWGPLQISEEPSRKGTNLELWSREHGFDVMMVERTPARDGAERDESLLFRLGASAKSEHQPGPAIDPEVCTSPRWRLWGDAQVSVSRGADASSCVCTHAGCRNIPGPSRVVSVAPSGLLAFQDRFQETVVQRLAVDGTPLVETTLGKTCRAGTLTDDGRVMVLCIPRDDARRTQLMELAADTLAEVGARDVAIPDVYGAQLQSVDGELVVTAIAQQAWSPQQVSAVQLAPVGCTGDCAAPRIRLDAWEGFGVLRHADGSVEVAGDAEAAGRVLVCRQGNSLRRWSACREAFSTR